MAQRETWRNVVALGLVALLAAACQGNPVSPTTPPSAPPAPAPLPTAPKAVLSVGDGNINRPLAALNFTRVLFDASRSEGDGLTYLMEFGDGASSTEPVVRHRLEKGGLTWSYGYRRVTARLTVMDRFGRSDSTEQQYFLVSLGAAFFTEGVFSSAWENSSDYELIRNDIKRILTFTQDGATLGGTYIGPYNRFKGQPKPRRVSGTLTDDGGIRARTDDGAEFSGVVAWGTGRFTNEIVLSLSLKDELSDRAVVDFYYVPPMY